MKSKILLSAFLLSSGVSCAHHLDAISSVQYSIEQSVNSNGTASYDLTHGIVRYIDSNGSIKRYAHAHMARSAPWNAHQIFGKITVNVANELAGTWYIYK